MSVAYQAVGWSAFKKSYDLILWIGIVLYLAIFCGITLALFPAITLEILLIRAFGSAAFLLLHLVLCIGPLARLDRRFLPLLYNRRHMGVSMFLLAALHGALSTITYHAGGDMNPFLSVFLSDAGTDVSRFPFQAFGFVALAILFLMAATSHDFWLANLTAPVWKALHMLVYVAYAALVVHVVFGVLQAETSWLIAALVFAGMAVVIGLHLIAGFGERDLDCSEGAAQGEFIEVCGVDNIPENRARIVMAGGERVAVFKYGGKISAISNVCQHQNGPLGEGKVADGCVTCPWHGYQYLPDTGASPPPFTEKVPTFHVKVEEGRVFVNPKPNPPGTHVEPAKI